jgi:hypothetical protein
MDKPFLIWSGFGERRVQSIGIFEKISLKRFV